MAEEAEKIGAALCGSLIVEDDGNYYNRFILIAGGSAVIDYLGNYLVEPSTKAGTWSATLDMAALSKFREKFPFHLDADAFALSSPG